MKSKELSYTDKQGKPQSRTVEYYEGKGVLEIGTKKLEVSPRITVGFGGSKDGSIERVSLNAYLTLTGKELGLTAPGAEGELDIRIGMTGTTLTSNPTKK